MRNNKTFTPRPADIDRAWWVVDAEDLPLGRLASEIAQTLRVKRKPTFSPHKDMGDFVIVINADKVAVTGSKAEQKQYFRHSGFPGGIRSITFEELRATHPERIIEQAVKGMLPKNRLGRQMARKLKVYAGPEHPHASQKPEPLSFEIRKVVS